MDCSNKVELVEGHSRSGAEWSRANKVEKVEVKIVQKSPANIFSLSDFVFYCSLAPSSMVLFLLNECLVRPSRLVPAVV